MSGGETLRDTKSQSRGASRRLRPFVFDQVRQRASRDEFHLKKVVAAFHADRMNRHDVGMIKRRSRATFIHESLDIRRILKHECRWQDLERAFPV